eukprot:9131252-Lingulodinium_polyedra.AAC.1
MRVGMARRGAARVAPACNCASVTAASRGVAYRSQPCRSVSFSLARRGAAGRGAWVCVAR